MASPRMQLPRNGVPAPNMKKAAREVAAFFEKKGKGEKGTGWLAPRRLRAWRGLRGAARIAGSPGVRGPVTA